MSLVVPVLPGDGIGPAVIEVACAVLRALGHTPEQHAFGLGAWQRTGRALPPETEAAVRAAGFALVGAATSAPDGCASPILELRRTFELDLLVRPSRHALVVGHAFEGLYGAPEDPGPPAVARRVITEAGADRLLAEAFRRATTRVTLVDKPTVFRASAALFRAAAERHARPGISFELVNMDAFVAAFVRDQRAWDVLAGTSLFSDVLSDLTAAFDHGVGGAPSMSVGPELAIFEPVHGSAPHRASHEPQRADPTGAVLAAAMLLEHLGSPGRAAAVRAAVRVARAAHQPGTSATELVAASILDALTNRLD